MHSTIEEQREIIAELCRRFRVHRFEIFGSATTDRFNADTSDLDFLVEFQPLQPGEHADNYFGLLESLQELFGRPVDLVMTRAIENRYFLEAIQPSRTLLYAA